MARQKGRRYPWAPLATQLDAAHGERLSAARQAAILGTSARQVVRWRQYGVSAAQADDLAGRAGFVAYELWPDLLDDTIAELERVCAAADCDTTFLLNPENTRGHRIYCSSACGERARRAKETPERRAKRLAASRARYRANRDRLLAETAVANLHPAIAEAKRRYRRDYYARNRERELERQRAYDRARAAERAA